MVPVISTKPSMDAVRTIIDSEERYLTALLLADSMISGYQRSNAKRKLLKNYERERKEQVMELYDELGYLFAEAKVPAKDVRMLGEDILVSAHPQQDLIDFYTKHIRMY